MHVPALMKMQSHPCSFTGKGELFPYPHTFQQLRFLSYTKSALFVVSIVRNPLKCKQSGADTDMSMKIQEQ